MEKELISCTGVLLRADLTGHGHSTLFGRWAWMAMPCQVSPQKDTCAGFLFFSHNVLLHYQHHTSKNWRPILSCSCFWTFAHCALCSVMFSQCLYYTTVVFLIKLQIIIHYTTRSNTVVVSKIYNLSLKKANILVPSLGLMSKKNHGVSS